MKKITAFFLLLSSISCLQAQTFGGHPPGLRWQQINTPNVRVIFPEGMEAQAGRTASIIDFIHENNLRSVGDQTEKIDLVIQNQTVIPNGYVSVAPFRSEFFATPPQDPSLLGSLDWIDLLTIHEYRHVVQYTNADRGLTRFLRNLFGDLGWGGGAGLSIPGWYWEGDAVLAETALTNAGRGRLPAFTLEQRAILLDDRRYNYMKASNGSWKDLQPDHYTLGYSLCQNGREQFGNDVWKDVFQQGASYRPVFYSFSGALKRQTGVSTRKLYQMTYDSLASQLKSEQAQLNLTDFSKINQDEKQKVTSYTFPHELSNGHIVCVRSSFDKIANLTAVSLEGIERRLTTQGIVIDPYISENNDQIAWSEIEINPRWGNVYYSVIVTYDYQTGVKKRLTSKSKYFSPAFSNSGKKIAAVHVSENQQNEIRILDARTGEVLERLPNPGNHFLMYPHWADDDRALVYIDKTAGKMALVRHDLAERAGMPLTPYSAHVINTPHVSGDRVFFSASFSGIDNIYVIKMGEPAIWQVTSASVGAFQPAVSADGETLYFSDFTSMGYDLCQMPLDPDTWQQITIKEPADLYSGTAYSEEGGDILSAVPHQEHAREKYRPPFGGLRLHSWLPTTNGPSSIALQGLMNNVLNNTALTVSLGYNLNENSPELIGLFQYGGFFPVISLEGGYSQRLANLLTTDRIERLYFHENSLGAGVSVPLQWYHGAYFAGLEVSGKAFYRSVADFRNDSTTIARPGLNFANTSLGLTFYNLQKTAPQHIRSRFGQFVQASYARGINRSDIERLLLQSRFYFPGLLPNHSIEIEADYMEEKLANPYQFSDLFEYARGYSIPANDKVWRVGANYHFPIVYPDWGFAGLLYFRRIRGNIFYDQSRLKHFGANIDQRSTGGELMLDTQWFNIPAVISIGGRYSYLLKKDVFDEGRDGRFEVFFVTGF